MGPETSGRIVSLNYRHNVPVQTIGELINEGYKETKSFKPAEEAARDIYVEELVTLGKDYKFTVEATTDPTASPVAPGIMTFFVK